VRGKVLPRVRVSGQRYCDLSIRRKVVATRVRVRRASVSGDPAAQGVGVGLHGTQQARKQVSDVLREGFRYEGSARHLHLRFQRGRHDEVLFDDVPEQPAPSDLDSPDRAVLGSDGLRERTLHAGRRVHQLARRFHVRLPYRVLRKAVRVRCG